MSSFSKSHTSRLACRQPVVRYAELHAKINQHDLAVQANLMCGAVQDDKVGMIFSHHPACSPAIGCCISCDADDINTHGRPDQGHLVFKVLRHIDSQFALAGDVLDSMGERLRGKYCLVRFTSQPVKRQ